MPTTHLNLEQSATVTINSLALQKRAKGERVYNLSAGEPMVQTPDPVIQAAYQAMQAGKTHYAPVPGIPELRAVACQWLNQTYATSYAVENTVVTCGGKYGIYALLQAMIQPGDEVIIVAPYWVSYTGMVKLFNGVPKIVPTREEQGWKVTVESLEKAVSAKTRVLILNSGSNPTGVLYDRQELQEILEFADRHNLSVISDEVYSGLVYGDKAYVSCGSFPAFQDRVFVIQSCSKSFAMTGWRVGFVFGPASMIKVITTLQGQSTTGTSSISQWAALAAFQNAAEIIPHICDAMEKRRDVFINTFNELFGANLKKPDSALYAFVPLAAFGKNHTDSVQFCEELMEKPGIAAVPGLAFGQEGYVRFAFGEKEAELTEGLQVLKKYLS